MNVLKCCFNWRVIVGLAAVALGVALLVPRSLTAIGPLLFYAICPLSMLVMMWTMYRMGGNPAAPVDRPSEPMVTIPASLFAKLSERSRLGLTAKEAPQQPLDPQA